MWFFFFYVYSWTQWAKGSLFDLTLPKLKRHACLCSFSLCAEMLKVFKLLKTLTCSKREARAGTTRKQVLRVISSKTCRVIPVLSGIIYWSRRFSQIYMILNEWPSESSQREQVLRCSPQLFVRSVMAALLKTSGRSHNEARHGWLIAASLLPNCCEPFFFFFF